MSKFVLAFVVCLLIEPMSVYGQDNSKQPNPQVDQSDAQQVREAQTSNLAGALGFGTVIPSDFEREVRPLLVKYCVDCHAPDVKDKHSFLAVKTIADVQKHADLFASVLEQLETKRMPPRDSDQPTDAERKHVVDWLKKTIPAHNRERIAAYVVEAYGDKKGTLWFGTMSKGAARFDGKALKWFNQKNGLPSSAVASFAEDKGGNLWMGTQGGLCRIDGDSVTQFGLANGLPSGMARVKSDRSGNIWAGMNDGVYRFDGSFFSKFNVPVAKEKIASFAIFPGQVSFSLEDRNGNLWFSTDGYGAFKFDGKEFTHFSKKTGLCSNNVTSILEDKQGNIWFTCMQSYQPKKTGDGGVCRYDGKTISKFANVKGLHQNDIYTIFEDSQGQIWIGATHFGVYRFDGTEFQLYNKTDRPYWTRNLGLQAMLEEPNGDLWFGFSGGLFQLDGDTFRNVSERGLQKK